MSISHFGNLWRNLIFRWFSAEIPKICDFAATEGTDPHLANGPKNEFKMVLDWFLRVGIHSLTPGST